MPIQLIPANGSSFRGINKSKSVAKLTSDKQDTTATRNRAKLPFLCLPGEIRNKVYEYVLTEPEGLHFRCDKNKTSRLYSKLEFPPQGKDPLHSLEANQLKYVCRELWYETKGYGIKYNTLNFTKIDSAYPHAVDQAMTFLSGVNPQRMKWLRYIKISLLPGLEEKKWASTPCEEEECDDPSCTQEEDWRAGYHNVIPLLKFAHLYPHITFDLTITLAPHHCRRSVPGSWPLVTAICSNLIVFRGREKELLERRLRDDEGIVEKTKEVLRNGEELEALDAPNVKFRIPKDWFDEKCIRRDCERKADLEWVEDGFEGGIDGFVEYIRGWAENGF